MKSEMTKLVRNDMSKILCDKENLKNTKQKDSKLQLHYVVNEFFQDNGKTKKSIVEEYIIREASSLL